MISVHAALLTIDIQNDFCPGGSLAVPESDSIISVVNRISGIFRTSVLTQDWHPFDHISFASSHKNAKPYDKLSFDGIEQVLWPDHCVAGSPGANFPPSLDTSSYRLILRKGVSRNLDSYSAFFENDHKTPTGLDGWLKSLDISEIWIAGLATDYCVLFTAMDAIKSGYKTIVIEDAIKAVDVPRGTGESAVKTMKAAGINFKTSIELG